MQAPPQLIARYNSLLCHLQNIVKYSERCDSHFSLVNKLFDRVQKFDRLYTLTDIEASVYGLINEWNRLLKEHASRSQQVTELLCDIKSVRNADVADLTHGVQRQTYMDTRTLARRVEELARDFEEQISVAEKAVRDDFLQLQEFRVAIGWCSANSREIFYPEDRLAKALAESRIRTETVTRHSQRSCGSIWTHMGSANAAADDQQHQEAVRNITSCSAARSVRARSALQKVAGGERDGGFVLGPRTVSCCDGLVPIPPRTPAPVADQPSCEAASSSLPNFVLARKRAEAERAAQELAAKKRNTSRFFKPPRYVPNLRPAPANTITRISELRSQSRQLLSSLRDNQASIERSRAERHTCKSPSGIGRQEKPESFRPEAASGPAPRTPKLGRTGKLVYRDFDDTHGRTVPPGTEAAVDFPQVVRHCREPQSAATPNHLLRLEQYRRKLPQLFMDDDDDYNMALSATVDGRMAVIGVTPGGDGERYARDLRFFDRASSHPSYNSAPLIRPAHPAATLVDLADRPQNRVDFSRPFDHDAEAGTFASALEACKKLGAQYASAVAAETQMGASSVAAQAGHTLSARSATPTASGSSVSLSRHMGGCATLSYRRPVGTGVSAAEWDSQVRSNSTDR